MSWQQRIDRAVDERRAAEAFRRRLPVTHGAGRWLEREGERWLNFSSNDYLGLSQHPAIIAAWQQGATRYGVGAGGSGHVSGYSEAHRALEEALADWLGYPRALLFISGFAANQALIAALVEKDDRIVADRLSHASLLEAASLSPAQLRRFTHNDPQQLAQLLAKPLAGEQLAVTEGIFSMDGDVAPLARLAELKKTYPNVMLYVDEAHAVGVRGQKGLGIAEEQGCLKDIDFLCGTFGKALASVGAYVVCSQTIREYLVNRMRTLIFTTALPPFNTAWTKFVLSRLDTWSDRRNRLARHSLRVRQAIQEGGKSGPSSSHIIPVVIVESRDTILKPEDMQRKGFYVLPVRPPTVPEGTSRLRISLTAALTDEETDRLCTALATL